MDEGPDAAKRGIATRMRDISVIAGADFGVTKYGAILYQLARKFMWGNTSEPDISELIRAGNDVPGWHTGGIQGSGVLSDMKLDFPHTYLGGMPFVCANSKSADPCASGAPTWPSWVPASSPTVAKPGRSDDAALTYLGWAAHMIQDASLPHHAANWTGREHEAQDAFGETTDYWYPTNDVARMKRLLMDIQVLPELEALLGTVAAPKSIDTICSSVGLSDSQVVDGSLNWQAVRAVFLESAERAYYRRKEVADVYDAVPYIKDAILGTVKLLLCAPNSQGPQSEALNRYFNGTTGEHWVTTDGVTSSTQKGVVALSGEGRRYSRVSAWDYGYWKLECGLNEFVSGTSQEPHPSAPFHGLRCSSGAGSARNCEARVVSGSAGYTGTWGDWDWGYYKADCPQGKVMVGASFDTESYQPHAIYCCSK